jgi:hypothetical protein
MTIQPETISSPANIEACRAELTRLLNAAGRLAEQKTDATARLNLIAEQLPIARADGDEQRVNALRAERAALESELRDIEPAEAIARQRVTAADQALARAEMPGLYAEIDAGVEAFVSAVNEANKLATQLRAKRARALQRYNRAGFPEGKSHELNPARAWRFGSVASQVMSFLGDFANQEITRD